MPDAELQALLDRQAVLARDFVDYWRANPPDGAPEATTRGAVEAFLNAAFANDERVEVRALRNREIPEPPRTLADREKCFVYVEFPVSVQEPLSCSGDGPWEEAGNFFLRVLVASNSGDALATEIYGHAVRLLRNTEIDGRVSTIRLISSDEGAQYGGNWWGVSTGIEFATEGV